jgi:aspartate-semialdehyde dehydrogenase
MASAPQVAIVGGESLLGAELRDVISESLLGSNIKLVGSEEQPGVAVLSEQGGEPVVITPLDDERLASSRIVFFAGSQTSTRMALARIASATPFLIDLTHALEDEPDARLRAPAAEPTGYQTQSRLHVIAHPASIVLGAFLRRLHSQFPVARAVAHVFEPVSERGRAGVNELQQQTIDLLSFRPIQKKNFDAQLSFNLLAAYGEEAPVALETVALRIERHLATLLSLESTAPPMPSLRVIQAGVMHGYSISVWVEHAGETPAADLRAGLHSEGIDVFGVNLDPPNVVGVAGQSGMSVGAVENDRNNSRAAWYWIAADNFRVAADNALAVARGALIHEARA